MTEIDHELSAEEKEILNHQGGFEALFRIVTIETIIMFSLTAALSFYIGKGFPMGRFYAQTVNAGAAQMEALSGPSITSNKVLSWSMFAATQIMTFTFNNIDAEFEAYRGYFTERGARDFLEAFVKSKFFQTVLKEEQFVTMVQRAAPTLKEEGFEEGGYVWKVSVPGYMTVRAGSKKTTTFVTIELDIVKVPTRVNPQGFAIQRFAVR